MMARRRRPLGRGPRATSSGQWSCSSSTGATHPAARVSARLGEVMWDTGRLREAIDRMDTALGLLAAEEADADVAALAAQVGRFQFFAGEPELAAERVETALELAESLGLPEVLSQAVNTKAMILSNLGRVGEAGALVRYALELALEHDIPSAALRGYNNVADLEARSDRYEQAAAGYRDGLALARRVGSRQQEWMFLGADVPAVLARPLGRGARAGGRGARGRVLADALPVRVPAREQRRDPLPPRRARRRRGADRALHGAARLGRPDRACELRLARGDAAPGSRPAADALRRGERGVGRPRCGRGQLRVAQGDVPDRGRGGASRSATRAAAEGLLGAVDEMRSGRVPQSMRAQAMRFRALLAAEAGDDDRAERLFRGAAVAPARAGDAVPDGGRDARARRVAGRAGARRRGRARPRRGAGGVRAAAARRRGSSVRSASATTAATPIAR